MGVSQRVARSVSETFLEAALREGRASKQELAIRRITVDQSLQSRTETDPEHVRHLANLEQDGVDLRPVIVFRDPSPPRTLLLADGFHRVGAKRSLRKASIWAYVIDGTRADAIRYSAGANLENSKPTTPADRLKALAMLLSEDEFRAMPNTDLARLCGVHPVTVGKHREAICERLGVPVPIEVHVQHKQNGEFYKIPLRPSPAKRISTAKMLATRRSSPCEPEAVPFKLSRPQQWAARIQAALTADEIRELIDLLSAEFGPKGETTAEHDPS